MPSLDQIRRWMRGEDVDGLPINPPLMKENKRKPDSSRVADKRKSGKDGRFTMFGKTDALINFGKHKGNKLSDLVKISGGRDYMKWMMREGFPDFLKEAIRHQLKN